jgi:hypothetical protein
MSSMQVLGLVASELPLPVCNAHAAAETRHLITTSAIVILLIARRESSPLDEALWA